MKKCSKCLEYKEFDKFSKRIGSIDGYRCQCKLCINSNSNSKKRTKKYYLNNRELLLNKSKDRKLKNSDPNTKRRIIRKMFELCNLHQSVCTKCMIVKEKYQFVKDNSRNNGLSAKCKGCNNLYSKNRKDTDIIFKLSSTIRSMISSYIESNGIKKLKSSEEIIGCKFIELKTHLEAKFNNGMSWENYGL